MARRKASVTQRDWSFGEWRADFLERDDSEAQASSARTILNMRILASGALTTRPGSVTLADVPLALSLTEARPSNGEDRAVILVAGGIKIFRPDGTIEAELTGAPWGAPQLRDMWVKPYGDQVLIGGRGLRPKVLSLRDFSLKNFLFLTGEDGRTEQPYYNFNPGVSVQPSATFGSVTITASEPVFSTGYIGTIIRYAKAEIRVTGYVSDTVLKGTVLKEAPPTYRVTVTDGSVYAVDQAVEGVTSKATGVITAIDGNDLTILMDGTIKTFADNEKLAGPSTPSPDVPKVVSSVAVSPSASKNWDEQVFSEMRGWPGYAEFHQNRLVFVDIPSIPSAIIMSKAGIYNSFEIGSGDGAAIFETYEDRISNRHLYAISAEDLLIFSQESVSYIGTRDLSPITPANIAIRRFSGFGASPVEPCMVDDGVAYVSKGGNRIIGAVLGGDANRYWSTVHLSEFAPHLIRGPQKLGSTEGDSDRSERYLFCVNDDGSVAVLRWQKAPFEQRMGWVLWETAGQFVDMTSVFGSIHAIVQRSDGRFFERYEDGMYVDGAHIAKSLSDVSEKDGRAVWAGNRYLGSYDENHIDSMCYPESYGPFQVGRPFLQQISMWPAELEETRRKGFVRQRNGRVAISVMNSTGYSYNGERRPYYNAGEDLFSPPPERTEVHRFINFGRTDHPVHNITKREPGPLTLLAFNVEVQG